MRAARSGESFAAGNECFAASNECFAAGNECFAASLYHILMNDTLPAAWNLFVRKALYFSVMSIMASSLRLAGRAMFLRRRLSIHAATSEVRRLSRVSSNCSSSSGL